MIEALLLSILVYEIVHCTFFLWIILLLIYNHSVHLVFEYRRIYEWKCRLSILDLLENLFVINLLLFFVLLNFCILIRCVHFVLLNLCIISQKWLASKFFYLVFLNQIAFCISSWNHHRAISIIKKLGLILISKFCKRYKRNHWLVYKIVLKFLVM